MLIKKIAAFGLALGLAFGVGETVHAETAENDFVIGYIGGEKYITGYNGSGGDIVIPDGIFGIGETAFQFNDNITSITFPASCQKIEMMAFSWSAGIKSVTFEGDMKEVGFMSFLGCTAIEKVTFMGDAVSENADTGGLAANAFMGCRSLKTVEFAENSRIDAIERAAFMDCENLTEVKLSREVGKIREYAFINCPELTRLEIPSMTELDDFAVGYMFDEETESEVKADGIASVRADMSFNYEDPQISEVVQKPITLIAAEGSPAEKYAQENGIAYEYKSETKPADDINTAEENPQTGGNSAFPAAAAVIVFAALSAVVFCGKRIRCFGE